MPLGPQHLLAVDGTNILYRSYHALTGTGLTHAGRPVWAVHGLTLTLARFLRSGEYTHMLVAFDSAGGCPERRALQPAYKQTRTPPSDDLSYQLQWAPMLLESAGLACWAAPGWEADDGIASAAASAPGKVTVVTSDRDAYQLVDERVRVALPDGTLLTAEAIEERTGVSPAQYPHVAALRGEPSDNLPGITGVGAKTAARLIKTFGTVDAVLSATDEQLRSVTGAKVVAALRAEGDVAQLTLQVGCLRRDLPVDHAAAAITRTDPGQARMVFQASGLPKAGEMLADALTSAQARLTS